MSEDEEGQIDFEASLRAMAPPTMPADALALDDTLENSLAGFDPLQLVIAIAGLQTDPAFQANAIRFEWLTRLALTCCRGTRRPTLADLNRMLNAGLAASRIPLLEDPIEDVMVEPVCTQRGAFLIFTGTWEKAGFCTEHRYRRPSADDHFRSRCCYREESGNSPDWKKSAAPRRAACP